MIDTNICGVPLSRRAFGLGALAAALGGCVPNTPLPANVVVDIQATCAWVPTVRLGVTVAEAFLPGAAVLAVNAAMDFLSNVCAAPPTDLASVSQKIIDAIQTIETALTTAKAAMARPGARRGLRSGDRQKVDNALQALRKGKQKWHIR